MTAYPVTYVVDLEDGYRTTITVEDGDPLVEQLTRLLQDAGEGSEQRAINATQADAEAAIRADERRRVAAMLGDEAGRLRDRARGIYEGEQVDADAACDEIDRLDIEAEALERMRKRIERESGEETTDGNGYHEVGPRW